MGAMFFASAAVQLPMGILLDRVGATRTLLLAGLLALPGIVTFALATSSWAMALGRVAIAAGPGGVITALYLIAMGRAPAARVAQATGTRSEARRVGKDCVSTCRYL